MPVSGSSAPGCGGPGGERVDVIVVGGGNAGLSAAHAAAERNRRVLVLERAEPGSAGGNSFYTAGAMRVVHGGLADLADLLDPDERHASTVLPPYDADAFAADMASVTEGRNDPGLTSVLVGDSRSALDWLHGRGLRFRLMYERQAYPDAVGRQVFWGGLAVGSTGGGKGLIEQHIRAAEGARVKIRHGVRVTRLLREGTGPVTGVTGRDLAGDTMTITADTVVLAAGGFEANPELRRRHLGEGWQRAKVRGTPLNTGDLLTAALEVGAAPYGDWSTCHSVAWDAWFVGNEGNRDLTNRLTRSGYPLGIMVNVEGKRFVDEGADFRNYTYAKYGREILSQPGGVAFQLFDATTRPLLRVEEYAMPGASVIEADTLAELAAGIGVDARELERTVAAFNASIDQDVPLDLAVTDGRAAHASPPKSNWAIPLEASPFSAFPVTCGITFTFGGLHADTNGRVLDTAGQPIPGLFVCGEMLGGLFSGNYPGGSGLTAGAVFGRRAGSLA